jgi:hypothetical protein
MKAVASAVAAVAIALCPRPAAADEPSDGELVGVGLGLAIPTYVLGVTLHEGSHALVGKAFGGEVLEMRLYPGRNPRNGAFQFGWVRVRGDFTRGERTAFLLAPKLLDLVMLGGWNALHETDNLPSNTWGNLALLVWATGFWVDFSKDVLVFHSQNDVVKVMAAYGLDDELERLPVRLVYAAVSVGLGYLLYQGYDELFERNNGVEGAARDAVVLPILSGSL